MVKEDEEDQEHVGRMDNITKWTGLTGHRLLRLVDRRQKKIIHEAASPHIEES